MNSINPQDLESEKCVVNFGDRDTRSQWISVATEAEERYLMGMATSTLRGSKPARCKPPLPAGIAESEIPHGCFAEASDQAGGNHQHAGRQGRRYYLAAQLR